MCTFIIEDLVLHYLTVQKKRRPRRESAPPNFGCKKCPFKSSMNAKKRRVRAPRFEAIAPLPGPERYCLTCNILTLFKSVFWFRSEFWLISLDKETGVFPFPALFTLILSRTLILVGALSSPLHLLGHKAQTCVYIVEQARSFIIK